MCFNIVCRVEYSGTIGVHNLSYEVTKRVYSVVKVAKNVNFMTKNTKMAVSRDLEELERFKYHFRDLRFTSKKVTKENRYVKC